jgi:6-pyruvoyltetrahydropterin/6-carboxytetrahydropterin synthase
MGRKKLSDLPPELAAKYRADMQEAMRKAWLKRDTNGLGTRKNGMLQADVQEKVSQAVKQRWTEGNYQNRINGMAGLTGANHHMWGWGVDHFRDIYTQFWPLACESCGETDKKIDVHHIDEDHNNYLLSNLRALCVPCHQTFHMQKDHVTPFFTISKSYSFEYAHILPWHPGKCGHLHGHSGHLTVYLRGRLNKYGIVEDFYDVSRIVKMAVIDKLDHQFLNDFLENPTSEEILLMVWLMLEDAGIKGLHQLEFKETDSSSCILDKHSILETFGWTLETPGGWKLIRKPPKANANE